MVRGNKNRDEEVESREDRRIGAMIIGTVCLLRGPGRPLRAELHTSS